MMEIIIIFFLTYIIGAIPSGYWMGKLHGIDLTATGSGSTGATNVLRLVGKWQAIFVFAFDIAKGYFPIHYAKYHSSVFTDEYLLLLLTLVPILAHSKSLFIGFKGGKSSATGFGVLLALNPWVAAITIVIWSLTVWLSGFSSLGSIVAIPLVPVWLYLFHERLSAILFGLVAFVYIVLIKHRSNIKRLLDGTEHNFKKAKKDAVE